MFILRNTYTVMKKLVFLLVFGCTLVCLKASAQRQNTYFLKNNGDFVSRIDSADFIRVVQEPAKKSTLFPTNEFYTNGHKKSYGYSLNIDPITYEGQYISFYDNGAKKQFINYQHGRMVDSVFSYFPNGKLYSSMFYVQSGENSIVYVNSVKDSTGANLVTAGNGHAVLYDADYKYITGKGNVKNGKYDGVWTGELRTTNTLSYKEVYADGILLSGESVDGKGRVYPYTESEMKPVFTGGMTAFYRKLAQGIRYPKNAATQHIQGVAHIKFVILTNGEISDVHVINDVDSDLAAEAIRVIKGIKGWQPGSQKGRLVKVVFVVPVSFTLS
jgi:TonB family protein